MKRSETARHGTEASERRDMMREIAERSRPKAVSYNDQNIEQKENEASGPETSKRGTRK